jgi:hypothetical protein
MHNAFYSQFYAPPDDEALPLLGKDRSPPLDLDENASDKEVEDNGFKLWRWPQSLRSLCCMLFTSDGRGMRWRLRLPPPGRAYDAIERCIVHLSLVLFLTYLTTKTVRIREHIFRATTNEAFYFGCNVSIL